MIMKLRFGLFFLFVLGPALSSAPAHAGIFGADYAIEAARDADSNVDIRFNAPLNDSGLPEFAFFRVAVGETDSEALETVKTAYLNKPMPLITLIARQKMQYAAALIIMPDSSEIALTAKIAPAPPKPPAVEAPRPSSRKQILLYGGMALAVLIALGLVFLKTRRRPPAA